MAFDLDDLDPAEEAAAQEPRRHEHRDLKEYIAVLKAEISASRKSSRPSRVTPRRPPRLQEVSLDVA